MTLRTVLPENQIDMQLRQPLTLDAEDMQTREDLQRRMDAAKTTMGSQYLLHNYNPTVRPARSVN